MADAARVMQLLRSHLMVAKKDDGNGVRHQAKPARIYERRRWKCALCAKVFSTADQRKAHLETFHQKEKPFSCLLCGERFKNWTTLLRHVHLCHNDASYTCPSCGQVYWGAMTNTINRCLASETRIRAVADEK